MTADSVAQAQMDAQQSLRGLRTLIEMEQAVLGSTVPDFAGDRDRTFLQLAESSIADPSLAAIQALLEEMRGLRHYFGGYVRDVTPLDALIDQLWDRVRRLEIALGASRGR